MSTNQHYFCAHSVLRVRRSLPLNFECIKYNVIITFFFTLAVGGVIFIFIGFFFKITHSDVVVHQFHFAKWKKKINYLFSHQGFSMLSYGGELRINFDDWNDLFFSSDDFFFISSRNEIKCEIVRQHTRFWNELSLRFNVVLYSKERCSDGERMRA